MGKNLPVRIYIALLLCINMQTAYPEPANNSLKGCKVASDETLENMRGGFSISAGGSPILLSLGFQQVTFINGVLAAMTTINLPQTNSTAAIPTQLIPSQIIQNGPGNSYIPPAALPSNVMTVIQNTLNNQTISHMTIINATLASKQLLDAMNMASTLRQAMPYSLR